MTPGIQIDPQDPAPLYVQLDRAIRAAIATGRLPAGSQLPTVRQLAVDLRVNANTVARVYSDLERAGIVETRRGVGTFVSDRPPSGPSRRNREPELRALAARVAVEAAARGFLVTELVEQLRLHSKGE
jgi:GntR family transcriptional regulator